MSFRSRMGVAKGGRLTSRQVLANQGLTEEQIDQGLMNRPPALMRSSGVGGSHVGRPSIVVAKPKGFTDNQMRSRGAVFKNRGEYNAALANFTRTRTTLRPTVS